MMQDPAFVSQQFAAGVDAQANRTVAETGQMLQQGIGAAGETYRRNTVQNQQMAMEQQRLAMEQQQLRIRDDAVRGEIAYNEQRRQAAMQELAWARELHTSDMLSYQKEIAKAQSQYEVARLQKATEQLGGDFKISELIRRDPSEIRMLEAQLGVKFNPMAGGNVGTSPMDPKKREEILREYRTKERRDAYRDPISAAYDGKVWDDATGNWVANEQAAQAVLDRYQGAHSRPDPLSGLRANPDDISLRPSAPAATPTVGAASQQAAPPKSIYTRESAATDQGLDAMIDDAMTNAGTFVAPNQQRYTWSGNLPDDRKQAIRGALRSVLRGSIGKIKTSNPADEPAAIRAFVSDFLMRAKSHSDFQRMLIQ